MEVEPDMLFACELTLQEARTSVAEQTGLMLEERESSFWGGVYYRAETSNGVLLLHVNIDVADGEPVSTSAVPTPWSVAVVSIPGLVLGPPWRQVAAT